MGIDVTHSDSEQWERQRELLSAHLDGALEPKDAAALQAHLSTCSDCQHELAALRQTRALLRALPTPALPRSFALPETPETRRTMIRPVPGWARPAQQLGGIAAMIGVALLCGSALPSMRFGAVPSQSNASTSAPYHSSQQYAGSASSASATSTQASSQTDQAKPTSTPTTYGAEAGVTPTPQSTAGSAAHEPVDAQPSQPFPFLPVSGAVLLVGGIGAAAAGGIARRRPHNTR